MRVMGGGQCLFEAFRELDETPALRKSDKGSGGGDRGVIT